MKNVIINKTVSIGVATKEISQTFNNVADFVVDIQQYNTYIYPTSVNRNIINPLTRINLPALFGQMNFNKVQIEYGQIVFSALGMPGSILHITSDIVKVVKNIVGDREADYYITPNDCDDAIHIKAIKF